uniref:Cation-transporting P-type ATPase N-terminal domain-containing protein n=1 Tax=Setaria digitata TaxID=48799 RepID=A0A915Q6N6_9BILA
MNSDTVMQIGLPLTGFRMADVSSLRYFTFKKLIHLWYPDENQFISIDSLDIDIDFHRFHSMAEKGLNSADVAKRLAVYGKNLISVKFKPLHVLLFREVLSPFYIFQLFSVAVWFSDNYEIYASVIVAMSLFSISMDLYQTRSQERKLRSMVNSSAFVEVLRNDGNLMKISSEELVPGDVILIPSNGCNMQCDAVLINGTVIVNESMLTGESVPVTKAALPDTDDEFSVFSLKKHSRHTLFCGTQVLQTRYYAGKSVKAVVLRTAYTTLKGQLVRSIMYPKPVDFRFTRDLFKFVGFLGCIAFCGFSYTIVTMILRGTDVRKVIVRALDIVTVVVPPALPAAMSVGILASQMRLHRKNIYCIAPSTINTCGSINVVCFDKTGTLTEDGLDFHSVCPVVHSDGKEPIFGREFPSLNVKEMWDYRKLVEAVSTCHSLTRINGVLCGDPLDLILFKDTAWKLDETMNSRIEETARFDILAPPVVRSVPGTCGCDREIELAVLRQFTFSSSLQRMSVIVHDPEDESHDMTLYCKGAPEMIASLCQPSTIPTNYSNVVNDYAQHGYRLIAVAYKKLHISFPKSQRVNREQVENELTLLGLVTMENRLKSQTVGVIHQLNKAHIRTVMVTGDNILTALSVARECGIIQPIKRAYIVECGNQNSPNSRIPLLLRQAASSSEDLLDDSSSVYDMELSSFIDPTYQLSVSGPTFEVICREYPELLLKFVTVCDVFARMSPEQKQMLVNKLQEVDYTVAMCGDGANDCAALKAAHAGISLSEAEASIAAPFTSRVPDIRCVPMIIREGRAALVTSFGIFKYMASYSLTQFTSVVLLYWLTTNLTDFQFLFIDLFLVTAVAACFGYTPPCQKLAVSPPPTKLLSFASLLSVVGQLLIVFIFQLSVFIYTAAQPWFVPYSTPVGSETEDKRSMQGTAVFCLSSFQYLTLAVIYSRGPPYRKTIFSNIPLCTCLVILIFTCVWLTISPPYFVAKHMEYDPLPELGYRIFILIVAFNYILCSYLYETGVIEYLILTVREKWRRKHSVETDAYLLNKNEKILRSISSSPSWIPSAAEGENDHFGLYSFPRIL